jgi:hypothetical protein
MASWPSAGSASAKCFPPDRLVVSSSCDVRRHGMVEAAPLTSRSAGLHDKVPRAAVWSGIHVRLHTRSMKLIDDEASDAATLQRERHVLTAIETGQPLVDVLPVSRRDTKLKDGHLAPLLDADCPKPATAELRAALSTIDRASRIT